MAARVAAFCTLVLCCLTASAQDDLNVHGVVSDAMTSSKLADVKVTVKKDGANHNTYTTRANGKYEFYLVCGHNYEFIFSRTGYVDRKIVINSKNIPQEAIGAGIIMPTDMSMYAITPAMEGADLSVFDKPIGIAAYDPVQKDLVWDFNHTNKVKAEIFAFIRDMEKKGKEMAKEQTAADKAREAEEAKFAKFVKDGDAAMLSSNFQGGVTNYQAALDIKADDTAVKAKLADAQKKLAEKQASDKLNADFSAAIDAGDAAFRAEEYDKAVAKYEEALKLKPGEKYPKDKIAEANKLISDKAALQAKRKEFDDLVAKGDGHVGKSEYSEAVKAYEAALKIIATDTSVQKKLVNAQASLKKQEQEAAANASYLAAITAADDLFGKQEFEKAKAKYAEAQKLKPTETYPAERIALCDKSMADLVKAAADKAAFDGLMAKGEAAMAKQAYAEAITHYEGAKAIYPDNATASTKLEEARKMLAEQQDKADKQKRYTELITQADAEFKKEAIEAALHKYQQARDILPQETYPLDQINKINAALALKAQRDAAEKAYSEHMAAGEAAMQGKAYADALGHFEQALATKPGDKPAKTALDNAAKQKAEWEQQQATRQAYDALIATADAKFNVDNLAEARKDYEAALKILKESYPTQQIAAIDARIEAQAKEKAEAEKQAALRAKFDAAMAAGDAAFAKQDFAEAIKRYDEALGHMPGDATASQKRNNALAAMEAQKTQAALDAQYQAAISKGDAAFAKENFTDARNAYEQAMALKANENYPKEQIRRIDEAIAAREKAAADALEKQRQEKIAALVLEGDNQVKVKNYSPGIAKYEEALAMAPDRKDISDKIAAAHSAMLAEMESAALEQAYRAAIAKADGHFKTDQLAEARTAYEEALRIKPKEAYPAERIKLIDETFAAREKATADAAAKQRLEKVAALLLEGDNKLKSNNYEDAIARYKEAEALAPERTDIPKKIEAARNAMLGALEAEARNAAYKDAIAQADAAFNAERYTEALDAYTKAMGIKPEETYPPKRIDEVVQRMAERDRAEEDKRKASVMAEFNKLLKEGDDYFKKESYALALTSYQGALDLIPDNAEAIAKRDAAQKAMAERDAAKAALSAYQAVIDEADMWFGAENWEEARAKYNQALGMRPGESYPTGKLKEIDRILSERAGAEEAARKAEENQRYTDAINRGDAAMRSQAYEDAILAYEDALDVKPKESYPRAQIERAEQLMLEREEREAQRRRKETEAREAEEKRRPLNPNYQTVSNNSELQAEAFMREARLAEEREKYEKIKKIKSDNEEMITDLDQRAELDRMAVYQSLRAYADGESERFREAIQRYEERSANSAGYKQGLYESMARMADRDKASDMDNYQRVLEQIEVQADRNTDWERMQRERIMGDRQLAYVQLDQFETWSSEKLEERRALAEKLREEAVKHYAGNKLAEMNRVENSERISADARGIRDTEQRRSTSQATQARSTANENTNRMEAREAAMQARNTAKVEAGSQYIQAEKDRQGSALEDRKLLADEKRLANLEELRKLLEKDPAAYTERFRSELANNYPQGVTEESSTLGNKVIITRIVVKGTKGDEYKKVLDKSGNYYFKNGFSISESTWNRETLESFFKKD